MDKKDHIFPIYKEKGPTSFEVVEKIREITKVKKVGHGGTLDPLAQGVLPIAVGREGTKKINEIMGKEKEYIVDIKLGEKSSTLDSEGEKEKVSERVPKEKEIKDILKDFIGKISQIPPKYSAVKINGKRAYKLARAGKDFKLPPRKVEIKDIELLNYNYPIVKLKVTTGKGVYIRSLARDIGNKLNTGAYVKELERTKVGEFTKDKSIKIEEFGAFWG